MSGIADTFWHLLLDGPMMLADAVTGFTLSVTSDPSGASILLDGDDTGATTPAEIADVSASMHNVTVALDGYLPGINETVDGTAGGTTSVHFDLTAAAGGDESPLEPSFSADPTSGTVPLAVQFNDTTVGSPTGWLWDFGDGETSVEQHPVHTYADAGIYTVSLTVWTENGTTTAIREGCIEATASGEPEFEIFGASMMGGASAPTAALTGAPTSGTAPLTVTFTDQSTGDPTGWTWFFGDETFGEAWTNQTAAGGEPGWSGRCWQSSVALPDGSIMLMGGVGSGGPLNDTWRSTDNGTTWTQVNASAGWSGRFWHSSVALPDGSIVLMGGEGGDGNLLNDTWRSTDNGATWTRLPDAAWPARASHSSVVLRDGSIMLMGGADSDGNLLNDTWRSDDGGATWERQTDNAGWAPRMWHSSAALPDGSIVLMGGTESLGGETCFNDTWRSTDNGATWTRLPDAAWPARGSHGSAALPDGSIVLMGGVDSGGNLLNDTWRSTDGGTTWTQLPNAGWSARAYHTSAALPDGSIVLMGGIVGFFTPLNDVWRLQTAGSTDRNPSHTYTTPGIYSVALQAYNDDGCDSTREIDYVTVREPVPPEANFTGVPTSGSAPLNVSFTDQSTGDPTGWTWFFGDETYGGAWTNQTDDAGWSARAYHSSVALPDGSIVLMGGGDASGPLNDTWRSTDGGATWTQLPNAGWSARVYHTSAVLPDGSIALMGGVDDDGFKNDTWRSADGGATWTQPPNAGWSARVYHTSVVLPDGSIVLMGGVGASGPLNDTWRSTDNGATWTQLPNAGWPARAGHASVALPDGSIVLVGGAGTTSLNDTWRSTDGGATWTQLPNAGWPARGAHGSVALPDGSIVLMGGADSGENLLNDVWRLQTAGSAERNPTHTYTEAGTYSVTLQAYNDDGCNSTRKVDYITVMEPLEADFTGTPASGLAPLIVSFTDASTGSPTAWNWSFGDGTWFNTTNAAEKNPTHTYTAVGNYRVGLTVANAAGEDTLTRDNYITVVVPPAADFTGAPTSGAAPLTVSFTDNSTGATGWAWFFGDETYGDAWTNQTPAGGEPGWSARAGHASVALPGGSIVLMGGMGGSGPLNDVWRSTDNGATWTEVNASAGWPARFGHTSVALPDGSIVFMGGMGGSGNDTWRSTDGGATWTRLPDAAWPARVYHSSVALPDGSMVLMGGTDSDDTSLNDTWRSTDNGATWERQTDNAGWSARAGHASVALPDGSIVLMGGMDGPTRFNDTWRSTDNGATWALMNAGAGWSKRLFPSSVALPDGSILLMGGHENGSFIPLGDTWRSADNGATWTQLPNAGWPARFFSSSVALPDGSIVLIGGMGEGPLNDVWRLQPAGSTEQSPSHTYAEVGTYPVTLQAYNAAGYNASTAAHYITVSTPTTPIANFTANATAGIAPLAVQFNDTSASSPTAWNWTLGDGSFSEEQNPVHTYTSSGTYTVNLTAGNAVGSNMLSRAGYVRVTVPPAAAFTANVSEGNMPLSIQFADTSTGNVTAWVWDFGDGNTSADQHPIHTYVTADNYTVTLNASNDYGFSVKTETNYITVLASPAAAFTTNVTEGNMPLAVRFADESAGNVTKWTWDFGDGNTSTAPSPIHTYEIAGNYTVSLNVSNAYGFSVKTEANYITVLAPPAAAFTTNVTEGNMPLAVRFADESAGNVTTWSWDFGDGNTSTIQRPNHTYEAAGNYTVSLNASNAYGFNVSTVVDHIQVLQAPVANFTVTPAEGNAPLTVTFTDTSSGDVTAWFWDFGDGNTSTEQSPGHTYATSGVYTVSLNASNAYGFNVSIVTDAVRALEVPTAGFTSAPSEGNAPLTVQFTDASTGNVTAWHWDFGDGNISTEASPSHTYTSAGTYTVTLNASNAYGFNVSTVVDAVQVLSSPIAGFTFAPSEGNTPLAVQFNDTSVGNVSAWSWDFGDGNTSTDRNATHTYAAAGTYLVSLNASNAYGFSVKIETNYITVLEPPTAAFTANVTEGNMPLAVQFTDESAGNVTTWSWDFGDGQSSDEQNPAHIYTTAGTYMVSLNASNAYGFDASVSAGVINVLTAPVADFTFAPGEGNTPLAVTFTDASTGNITAWSWDFGDGATSSDANPTHTYANAGIYAVTLNTSNAYGWNASTTMDAVHVLPAPVANFTVTPAEGNAPLAVIFTDTSAGNVTAWFWDFGDGSTSTDPNPGHIYASAGTYTVTLNASNAYGFNVSTVTDAISVLLAPAANFTFTPGEGNAPLAVAFTDASVGNITAWVWNFGDGNTSNEQSPSHIYVTAGTYTVSLNVSNTYGFNVSTVTEGVVVLPAPVAGFTHSPDAGNAPLTVQFNDTSSGNITGWAWDFGDGQTSTEQNPEHLYASAGTYTVSLNSSNAYGFNVSTVASAVQVLPAPTAGFTFAPDEGNAPLTVQFNDTSSGNVTAWRWDFGDGNESSERNPSHTYVTQGTYAVSLNASNAYGFNVSSVSDAVLVLSPPTANFTYTPDEGNAPLTVTFTDASTGNVTAWHWDFGDGNTSTEQSPVHTYATEGTYTVSLNASNAYGFNVSTAADGVQVLSAPVAGFTFTPDEGNAALNVTFTDASVGNITVRAWDFGDGQTSAEQSPSHTYATAGIYTVTLNASNAYGSSVSVVADGIRVLPAPVANFTYAPSEGNAPLTVTFTDASAGNVTAWHWVFGDGNTSAEQNPAHTYANAGIYTVSLNVSNTYGFDVSTVTDAISVLLAPAANFTYAPDEGNAPLIVTFTDTSSGNVTAWLWGFGDGNASTEQSPVHNYASAGTYTVTLNVSNAYGFDVSTVTDGVSVLPAPIANFTHTPGEGNAPLTVQFNDASLGNVTAWHWDFGDGNESIEQSPSHTYTTAGIYTISLNASNTYGFNVSTVSDAALVLPPPAANFTCTPGEGNAPLTVTFTDASAGNVTAWHWAFGDGNTSTDRNTTHIYEAAGTYTVSLNVSNAYGSDIATVSDAVLVLSPPTASFTFAPQEGNAPLAVQFNDTSSGSVTAWLWTFGDGQTSAEQHPVHTYVSAGAYTVSLNASNAYGWNVSTVMDGVGVLPAPGAIFTYAPDEGNAPLTVTFTDASAGNVTAWTWDFGDGNVSSLQNPTHTYANAGIYTVSLNSSNVYGFNASVVADAVRVLPAPSAGFTFVPGEGNAPLVVQFADTSSGNVTAWLWDFGDGNASTDRNATHIYANPGTFTVTLNASNAYGFNVSVIADAISVLPAPVAGFTFAPSEGNAPLAVQFTDISSGDVITWHWDFGDGEISTEQNPSHTYASAGTYTVSLNASNAYGFNISTVPSAVSVLPAPVANFTYTPDEGNAPLTVTFTDSSTGNITAWSWDFGDGNTSTDRNATHTYASAGTYIVSLSASNAYGFNVSTTTGGVQVLSAPVAGFAYVPDEGNAPLLVQFTDTSAGNVTAWAWDFGDGQTSEEQNPAHTYTTAGTYMVSLNASNAYGFDASVSAGVINVLTAPVAGFTFAPGEGNTPLAVTFTDASTGNITAWSWDFGDGATSSDANPTHTYANAGTYTVTLNASNAYGFNVSTMTDGINVLPEPVANFTYAPGEGNSPLTVLFNDTSAGNVTAWLWDFGDGNASTDRNATHIYEVTGTYTVSLNVSNTYGFNVSTTTDAVQVLPAPVAGFTYTPGEGNVPLTVQLTDVSTGNVTAWHWDFDDGNESSEQNPSHTYVNAGTYAIVLNVSNAYGFNVSTTADAVSVLPAPAAGFTYTPDEGNAPLMVQFNDTSSGSVTAWHWSFGDGNTSSERDPSHTYMTAGTYTVSLNASNAYGFDVSTATDAVSVLPAPVAGFALAPSEGNAPLAVQFNDASSGNVTAWAWDFGDGNTSAEASPAHTYANAGTYTVTLNASNAYGSNIATVTDAIRVLEPPTAGFTFAPPEGNAPLSVQFNDTSLGNVTGWTWDFGDGRTSTDPNPTHTYTTAGIYSVSLNASNAYGFNISSVSDAVLVLSSPAANFTYTPDEGNAPLMVAFTDASAGNVTAWHWDFGDGNISIEANPSHIYAGAGTYTVTLNASNPYGFNVSTVASAVRVLESSNAGFTYTPGEGNVPLTVAFTDASTGNITAWSWDFGDGNTSPEQNAVHVYASVGDYTVSLNASNAYGFNVSTATDAVSVLSAPVAGFTFAPDEGNAPLTVTFTDASAGNVTAWTWDFGDGDTSTDVNPVHTYTSAGIYTVTLNASNVYGFNTSTVTDAARVLQAPFANFTHTPGSGNVPLTVAFTSASTGNIMATAWNFGDGSTSTETNPGHTYTVAGAYSVTLNVSNAYGWNSVTKPDAVIVTSPSHGKGRGGSVTPTGVPTPVPTSTSTPTPIPTSTTTSTPTPAPVPVVVELPMDTDGRVTGTIEIVASDTVGMLTIPGGVQAWDAAGGNLQEIIIVPMDTVNLTETHEVTDDTTSAFLFGQYAYRVEPDGATFSSPITLTFNIPRDVWATPDTANMSVLWQDTASGAWETIPIASIDGNETHVWVSASITHFSIYEFFMPRIDQATPAVTPAEPTIPWFLLVIIPIAIGTALYIWRKKKQDQGR